jgi:hypothetical protein
VGKFIAIGLNYSDYAKEAENVLTCQMNMYSKNIYLSSAGREQGRISPVARHSVSID